MKLGLLITLLASVSANEQGKHDESLQGLQEHLYKEGFKSFGNEAKNSPGMNAADETSFSEYSKNDDDMEDLLGRSRWCRKRDGICRTTSSMPECPIGYSESPKGRPYCMGRKRRCCYPERSSAPPPTPAYTCTELGGTEITYDGLNYCLRRECTSWDNTTIFCSKLGMTMAEPEDPNGLATYIYSLGLSCWYWLAGRGDGSNQIWLNGTVISNSDPLWSSPPNTSPDYCLALITCSDLERTLITYECDSSCGFDLCQDKKYPSSIGKRVAEAKYVDNPDYNLLTVKPDTVKKYQSKTVERVAEAKSMDNPDYNLLTVKPDTD